MSFCSPPRWAQGLEVIRSKVSVHPLAHFPSPPVQMREKVTPSLEFSSGGGVRFQKSEEDGDRFLDGTTLPWLSTTCVRCVFGSLPTASQKFLYTTPRNELYKTDEALFMSHLGLELGFLDPGSYCPTSCRILYNVSAAADDHGWDHTSGLPKQSQSLLSPDWHLPSLASHFSHKGWSRISKDS